MRILDRYILFDFIRNFLISVAILTVVFFIADYLRGVFDAEVTPIVLFRYGAYQIPQIICQMVPPAAMLGTMVTLSLLEPKKRADGHTRVRNQPRPRGHVDFRGDFHRLLLHARDFSRIVPPLARKRTYYWRVIKNRPDFTVDIKTSKIWYRSKNYIYNLRLYDAATSTIHGIGIYFFDNRFQLAQHVEAETAHFDAAKNEWDLHNGMLTIFPDGQSFPLSKHFSEKRFTLPETPKDFIEIEHQVDTLRLKELLTFIRRNKEAGLNTNAYEVDFHSRVAIWLFRSSWDSWPFPIRSDPNGRGAWEKTWPPASAGSSVTGSFSACASRWDGPVPFSRGWPSGRPQRCFLRRNSACVAGPDEFKSGRVMAILKIVTFPDPVLRQPTKEVTKFDAELEKLVADMFDTMYDAPGVGLAANQIGLSLRLAVIDVDYHIEGDEDDEAAVRRPVEQNPRVLVNPHLVKKGDDFLFKEDLLSVPGFSEEVKRAQTVTVRFQDLKGEQHTLDAEGLLAVAIQHEIDHLDGKLFIDRLSVAKRGLIKSKIKKERGAKFERSRFHVELTENACAAASRLHGHARFRRTFAEGDLRSS